VRPAPVDDPLREDRTHAGQAVERGEVRCVEVNRGRAGQPGRAARPTGRPGCWSTRPPVPGPPAPGPPAAAPDAPQPAGAVSPGFGT